MSDNVIYITKEYILYRKLWKEDRWKFSCDLIKLTMKNNQGEASEQDKVALREMERVLEENGGDWEAVVPDKKKEKRR